MVAKVLGLGCSFTRLAAHRIKTDERVDWADTRNLPTPDPGRAPRLMAATAKAAPDLKRLAGGSMGGRKLEKPVLHYSLYWPRDQRPVRAEMERAAAESLTALGLERHEALIVAHPGHLHVIANRVHPETGRAANLGLGWIRLSEWAERWERDHGGVRCHERVRNNARRRSRLPGQPPDNRRGGPGPGGFSPDPYPSGGRDRRSWPILSPVGFPKTVPACPITSEIALRARFLLSSRGRVRRPPAVCGQAAHPSPVVLDDPRERCLDPPSVPGGVSRTFDPLRCRGETRTTATA